MGDSRQRGAVVEVDPGSTLSARDGQVLEEDKNRTRVAALKGMLVTYAVVAIALGATYTESLAYAVVLGAVGFNAVLAAVLLVVARRGGYGAEVSTGSGLSIVMLALIFVMFLGVDSIAVAGMPVLIYYFGLGDSVPRRRIVFGTAFAGYLALLALSVGTSLPLDGVSAETAGGGRTPQNTAIRGAIFLVLLAMTYWFAAKSRRSTLAAIAALARARRRIRQRDALLEEAHADLDRAVERALAGRWSGREIGAFRVGNVIGRGAIGEVYEATDSTTGSAAAIKVLHEHLKDEAEHVDRFLREVDIVRQLESPHIPAMRGAGRASDGTPYLAMERLRGIDLATDLRRRTKLPVDEVSALVDQAGLALHAAHEAGVVHRDVKPQNLFRTSGPEGVWMVLDFGVSKLLTSAGTLTQGAAVGTPAYMAPEQARAQDVDARADVFSLAAVVYRALTGRPAFSGPSDVALLLRVAEHQPICPSDLVSVDADLDLLLAIGLAKNPADRFATVDDFAGAWHDALRGALDETHRTSARRILAEHPWEAEEDDRAPTRRVG